MTLPAAYTDDALAAFVVRELGAVADQLGWVAETPRVAEAVMDAVGAYGVSSADLATDMTKLRALARVAAWSAAYGATAGNYAFSAGGQQFNRQQVHDHAKGMLIEVEREAAALGVGPSAAVIGRLDRWEPYTYRATPGWGW